jgi:RHH-type proline utilization regulon transcriptional repressor/proline dehydrogenase/delta 1-pyrroline-5-carboxylate dehydrogenase
MLQNPGDKVTLVQLTDEAFRSKALWRTAENLTHILDVQGVPRFFSPLDRTLLRGFRTFGAWLPGVAVPLVKEHMQQETANVVLPAEHELLREHLSKRQGEGVRMNLNLLGEAVLGEAEAARRLERCLGVLQLPEVEVLSVKISTIYSQILGVAREHTLRILCERLETLYRTAARYRFTRANGTEVPKFIYLDMEEYRDLQLTAQAFMRTLDRPGLEHVSGGIALQAYVPDSVLVHREINEWAERRVAKGGAPVTIRVVKGANMEAERVDAALHDWPQAPYERKIETDANYKRMLREGMEHLHAVRLGVASHNLFDLAYGLVLASNENAGARMQFEMLEGMANHQRRALLEQTRGKHDQHLLLYAPACGKEEFLNAIGYLLRRLDENTGPENFLRHAFRLEVGSKDWEELERGFREAFRFEASVEPRRTQNRLTETFNTPRPEMLWKDFHNEPDTDWSLRQNSEWAEKLVSKMDPSPRAIPLVIAGNELEGESTGECVDPSRPGAVVARYAQAAQEDIDRALACAKADPDAWGTKSVGGRSKILGLVAQEIRKARGELMRAALVDGGKILSESDPEVSEAVDFVEFYRSNAKFYYEMPEVKARPRGVVVVVPPWNFPIAIPCGGIAAALAAGNTVILKPASDTILVAWELCQCFWRAGISKRVLQFAPCPGKTVGQYLVTHKDVDAVILTGGTATALHMLKVKPDMPLFAETGGKNATIVTALSDRELAIKHVVHSAFSHAGQKCSATSLLLLEAEVYDDRKFQAMLVDAVESLRVESAWDLAARVGPLIRPPRGDLENGLKTLEEGESWALRPQQAVNNPNLWSPGIK